MAETDFTPAEVVQCVFWYFHNTDADIQYEAASGESWAALNPDYQKEQIDKFRLGVLYWFGGFDPKRKARWLAAALERYGEDAKKETAILRELGEAD